MESALMIGVFPVLYSVASDKSGYYAGRALWLGLISVYSMVLYVVRMPWHHIHEDFNCHGDITDSCLIECFEQLFRISVPEMWCYFYFIFIAFFFLMEFFMAQIRHKLMKIKVKSMQKRENTGEMEKGSLETIRKPSLSQEMSFLNFHQEKKLLFLNLLHFLLQVSIQTVSFCLLTFKHLPMIKQGDHHCSTNSCPGPYHCLIWEPSEKQLSIYTLSIFSFTIILLGTGSFVYSIYHHLLTARSAFKP